MFIQTFSFLNKVTINYIKNILFKVFLIFKLSTVYGLRKIMRKRQKFRVTVLEIISYFQPDYSPISYTVYFDGTMDTLDLNLM